MRAWIRHSFCSSLSSLSTFNSRDWRSVVVEKLFSLISLGFLTMGFIVCIAGADKDGAKDLANATDQLIQHVTSAQEANNINARSNTLFSNAALPKSDSVDESTKEKKDTRVVHVLGPSPAVKK